MPYCSICEREFDTKKGLMGHFRFKHRYELKQERPVRETPLMRTIGRNIERRMLGDAMMKAVKEERGSGEDSGAGVEEKREKKCIKYIDEVSGIW